jgi:hypothetical protein
MIEIRTSVATPPVDGLNVDREHVGSIQPWQDSLKSTDHDR